MGNCLTTTTDEQSLRKDVYTSPAVYATFINDEMDRMTAAMPFPSQPPQAFMKLKPKHTYVISVKNGIRERKLVTELKTGDEIITYNFNTKQYSTDPVTVTTVSLPKITTELVRITFTNTKSDIEAEHERETDVDEQQSNENHIKISCNNYVIVNDKDGKDIWRKAKEISKGDKVKFYSDSEYSNGNYVFVDKVKKEKEGTERKAKLKIKCRNGLLIAGVFFYQKHQTFIVNENDLKSLNDEKEDKQDVEELKINNAAQTGISWNTTALNPVILTDTVELVYEIKPIHQANNANTFYGCQFPHGYVGIIDMKVGSNTQKTAFIFSVWDIFDYSQDITTEGGDTAGSGPDVRCETRAYDPNNNDGNWTTYFPLEYDIFQGDSFRFTITYTREVNNNVPSILLSAKVIFDGSNHNFPSFRFLESNMPPHLIFDGDTHEYPSPPPASIERGYFSFIQDIGGSVDNGLRTGLFKKIECEKQGQPVATTPGGNNAFSNLTHVTYVNDTATIQIQRPPTQ